MKVISFNANGIRAAAKKGFFVWLLKQNADVICIQETKAHLDQLKTDPLYFPSGYFCEYVDAQKKGYSGVAIYSRYQPLNIVRGLGFSDCDGEGRYLQFDYSNLSIVSLYLPSGTSSEHRQTIKYSFLERLEQHFLLIKKSQHSFIVCGDYNIAHQKIDLTHWKSNQKNSGFLPEERLWMDKLLTEHGFVDAFRVLNKEPLQYTWWSYRQRSWEKNVGWRIDYQVVSPELANKITSVSIEKTERFSDHAPLMIEYQCEPFA